MLLDCQGTKSRKTLNLYRIEFQDIVERIVTIRHNFEYTDNIKVHSLHEIYSGRFTFF